MLDEEELFKNRIRELAERAYQNGQFTFTNFLNASKFRIYLNIKKELSYIESDYSSGTENGERMMVRFGSLNQFGYEEGFPIRYIRCEPLIKKFADQFTHRDFLGALMNLSVQRDMIGDIFLKDQTGYIVCAEHIAQYLCDNLQKVKRTSMKCSIMAEMPKELETTYLKKEITVSSGRLDAIISELYHISRNESLLLFRQKKVLVNGVVYENNSGILKIGDRFSAEGYGKNILREYGGETRKGKLHITVDTYQ